MKKIILVVAMVAISIGAWAQPKGVDFRKLNLKEAQETAAKEGKLLFIDLSMSGCSPCKYMADNIFPKPEVGSYYNEKFVSVHYNTSIDTTAEAFARKNNVTGFPTLVYMNPVDGTIIHMALGGKGVEELLYMGEMVFTPKLCSGYMNAEYDKGNKDFDFLVNYFLLQRFDGNRVKMRFTVNEIAKLYGDDFKNQKVNDFFFEYVDFKQNTLSDYFIKNAKKLVKKFGKEKVFSKISSLR